MDRSYAQYGVPSANQSLPYRRTLSTARSTASVSQGHVAALARSIQAGSMNVSPASHVTARMTHRSVHRSPDRTGREMPITIQRGRLPSQNTSVDRRISLEQNVSVGTTDYRLSRPTATMYSISTTKLPSLEKPKVAVTERAPSLTDDSELLNGGLAGLQNLGNTVKFFTRCLFAQFQSFVLLVLHELSPPMSVEHQTIAVVLFKQQSERLSEYFIDQCDERSSDARSVEWTTDRSIDRFLSRCRICQFDSKDVVWESFDGQSIVI